MGRAHDAYLRRLRSISPAEWLVAPLTGEAIPALEAVEQELREGRDRLDTHVAVAGLLAHAIAFVRDLQEEEP